VDPKGGRGIAFSMKEPVTGAHRLFSVADADVAGIASSFLTVQFSIRGPGFRFMVQSR